MKLSSLKQISIFSVFFITSCASTPKVIFKQPVDTKTKSINLQSKRTYSFVDSEVYFSNRFEGARLNGVDQLNDSTYVVHVLPENEPINHSPFYAFDVWSASLQSIILNFKYPEGYKHRYFPKIKTTGTWAAADSLNFYYTEKHASLKLTIDATPKIISGQELHSSSVVYRWVEHVGYLLPNCSKIDRLSILICAPSFVTSSISS